MFASVSRPSRLFVAAGGPFVVLVFVLLTLVAGWAAPARAQTSELSTFGFLRLEPSARAAALAGSVGAVDDGDASALFYNPALMGAATDRVVEASYLNHLSDLNAGVVVGSLHSARLGTTFGAGLRFLSYGELEGATATGERTGTFGAGDVALTLGAAWAGEADGAEPSRWHYGVNLHVVHAAIETARATALGLDLGVRYRVPAYDLVLSGAVANLGRAVQSFDAERNALPTDVRLSLSKRLTHLPLMISVTGYDLQHTGRDVEGGTTVDNVLAHVAVGGELRVVEAFRVRLGYDHRRGQELAFDEGRLAGVGAGFGLAVGRLRVDYAYNSWAALGGLHRFTLKAGLGGEG